MSVRFIKAGPHSTIQDAGRWGWQSQGVPVSGAMDETALITANLLVGNDRDSGCIELATGLIELEFLEDTLIAFSGMGLHAFLGKDAVAFYKPIWLRKGAIIKLKPSATGGWSYLSAGGGWIADRILNSSSTYSLTGFGGFKGRRIRNGDQLKNSSEKSGLTKTIESSLSRPDGSFYAARWSANGLLTGSDNTVRIFAGNELSCLSKKKQQGILQKSHFTISIDSNRIGYRLDGPKLKIEIHEEMISSAVTNGTIQLTNNGDLIVLLADGQTVGGYPKIGQVINIDLPKLVQRRVGETIQFRLISFEEAVDLFLNHESELRQLELGIKFKFTS